VSRRGAPRSCRPRRGVSEAAIHDDRPLQRRRPTDAIARIVAERLRASLGWPVIVKNVAGASGSIGVGKAVRAAPDGYTICLGTWPTPRPSFTWRHAPKSNAAYKAFGAAMRTAKEGGSLLPPKHILNAPTKLMKGEGYGEGYQYDHDAPDAFSGQDYFPDALGRRQFYDPPERGFEREIRKRLEYWSRLRRERGGE
jgi:hypothetical protein